MHRRPLLTLLSRYRAQYGAYDAEACGRIARFVEDHEDCFERSLMVGHVTGSAWIVDASRTHCLLVHHRKLDRWLQLGGHSDGDSDTLAVALREGLEESGLNSLRAVSSAIFDCDVHWIPERKSEPGHHHHDVRFLLEADIDEPLIVSEESNELAWVKLADVARLAGDDSVVRMVAKTQGSFP